MSVDRKTERKINAGINPVLFHGWDLDAYPPIPGRKQKPVATGEEVRKVSGMPEKKQTSVNKPKPGQDEVGYC